MSMNLRAMHPRRGDGERGAILILSALALVVVMASAAMGIDIARQVSKKRSVEEIADLAAHDASYAFKPLEANMSTLDASSWFQQFPAVTSGNYYQLAVLMAMNSMVRNTFLQSTATTSCSGTTETFTDPSDVDTATMQILVPDSSGVNQPVPCNDPPGTGTLATSQGKMITTTVTPHTSLHYDFLPGTASVQATGTQQDRWSTGCTGLCGGSTGGGGTTTVPTTVPGTTTSARGEFTIGSFLARETLNQPGINDLSATTSASIGNIVSFNNSLLISGLGVPAGSLNLDVVSYQGLENASVTIESMATAAGFAGRPDQLFAQSLTITQLLTDMKAALTAKGDSASLTAAGVIGTLIAANPTTSTTFTFGQLFGANAVTTAGTAILTASTDVGDLLTAAMEATVVNGAHLLTVAVPVAGVTGVVSATLKLGLIEPPKSSGLGAAAQNPDGSWITTASTSQIRAELDLTLPAPNGATGPVQLPIYLAGAQATGNLTSLTCDALPANQTFVVGAATKGLTMTVGAVSDPTQLTTSTGTVSLTTPVVTSVALTGSSDVGLTASGSATVAGTSGNLNFPVSAGQFAATYMNDMRTLAANALGGQLNVSVTPSGNVTAGSAATVNAVATATAAEISAVLSPAVAGGTAPIDTLVSSVTQAVGLGLAGADVTGYAPYCGP